MVNKYFDGVVPAAGESSAADLAVQKTVSDAALHADAAIQRLAIHESLAAIWTIVEELNGYITIQEPWVLAKSDETRERLGTVLYTAMEGLRALAVLLSPVLPDSTTKLWEALGAPAGLGALTDQRLPDAGTWGQLPAGSVVGKLEALFPRIETDVTVG
jgi:methionyl-tRNA synthetase